jgi:hypothetical protein
MIALLALIYIGSLIVGMAIGVCAQAVNKLVSK